MGEDRDEPRAGRGCSSRASLAGSGKTSRRTEQSASPRNGSISTGGVRPSAECPTTSPLTDRCGTRHGPGSPAATKVTSRSSRSSSSTSAGAREAGQVRSSTPTPSRPERGDESPAALGSLPGPFGFGGPSTAELFYELVQLYVEQGAQDHIHFRTLYALFSSASTRGAPSSSRRTTTGSAATSISSAATASSPKTPSTTAKRKAYVHMQQWSLFTGWSRLHRDQPGRLSLPGRASVRLSRCLAASFGPSLRTAASSASALTPASSTHLKPLEQRLAVYLAKMFVSQTTHKRYVDELAAALPIQVAQPKHLRFILKRAAEGLLAATGAVPEDLHPRRRPRTAGG